MVMPMVLIGGDMKTVGNVSLLREEIVDVVDQTWRDKPSTQLVIKLLLLE